MILVTTAGKVGTEAARLLMMARGIAETSSFGTATGDGRIGHIEQSPSVR